MALPLYIKKFLLLFCVVLIAGCVKKLELQTIASINGPTSICVLSTNLEYSLSEQYTADYILWTVPDQAQIISGQGTSKIKVNFGRKEGSVCAQLYTDGEAVSDVKCINVTFGVAGSWCRDINMPSTVSRVSQTLFVINDNTYIVMGSFGPTDFSKEVWMFNPEEHLWTQKQNFPGPFRIAACGFSLNSKGYVCCGDNALSGPEAKYFNDLWEYSPTTNSWIEKDTLPGSGRQYAFAFTIENKAYVGNGKPGSSGLLADFYEYDPVIESWTQKTNTPFFKVGATTFSINNIGYVCAGSSVGDINSASMFKYTPATDSWQELNPLPSSIRRHAAGFSIGNKGYLFGGSNASDMFNDFWEYNTVSGQWTQQTQNTSIEKRAYSNAVNMHNKGYIIGGSTQNSQILNDMWVYTP
ncbi:MAG: kelch repeat-containing protein [Bacteroidia bacterium]